MEGALFMIHYGSGCNQVEVECIESLVASTSLGSSREPNPFGKYSRQGTIV
jgi:hypothetical protein